MDWTWKARPRAPGPVPVDGDFCRGGGGHYGWCCRDGGSVYSDRKGGRMVDKMGTCVRYIKGCTEGIPVKTVYMVVYLSTAYCMTICQSRCPEPVQGFFQNQSSAILRVDSGNQPLGYLQCNAHACVVMLACLFEENGDESSVRDQTMSASTGYDFMPPSRERGAQFFSTAYPGPGKTNSRPGRLWQL